MKRARWLQEMVIRSLGAKCVDCGTEDLTLLSVDHVNGITFDRRRLRYDARVERYIEELVGGVALRCLCLMCNSRARWVPLHTDPEVGAVADMLDAAMDLVGVTKNVTEDLPDAPF